MPGLFDPIKIGSISLKNRIVMPPMASGLALPDGAVTEELINHYAERAKNNVGLILIEHSYVTESGKASDRQLGIHKDELILGLRELAQTIHRFGAKTAIQINHAGARGSSAVLGHRPFAPSVVQMEIFEEVPRELSIREIKEIVKAFGLAAARAKQAGFDAVEIHGAHGFLLNEFFSSLTNKRNDAYGGSREKRMRLPLEVVRKVREQVGDEFPIFYRLGSDDMMTGGITIQDSRALAIELVKAGVDLIDVSGGLVGSRPDYLPPGYFVPQAHAIKKVTNVPVIAVGGIKTPELADSIIREGKADLVAIGRALLADPKWAVKAASALN